MNPLPHAIVGAVSALAPDAALALFVWRKRWLPERHPLVRFHRFLHSGSGLVLLWCIGWTTHVLIDWFSPHRAGPDA